jgi:hypothetical protein
MACKQVEDGDHDSKLVLTGSGNIGLYQAYLGRVQVSGSNTFDIFVDDSAVQVATTGALRGDIDRTCYDGVSYSGVNTLVSVSETQERPETFSLSQNYPNPFNPTTAISYQLIANSFVTLKVYDMLGRTVATVVNQLSTAGKHTVQWDASGLPSGVYVYRLHAGIQVSAKKMILLK